MIENADEFTLIIAHKSSDLYPMSVPVRVRLLIQGTVQGVWYRKHAADEAIRLGLTGWVRNLPDGRVEAAAQGPQEAVDRFVAWCRQGPPLARVTAVEVHDEPVQHTADFVIRR
jgi:acylphosphatase